MTCNRLVESAKDAGGRDNITVVLAKFLSQLVGDELVQEAEADLPAETEIG